MNKSEPTNQENERQNAAKSAARAAHFSAEKLAAYHFGALSGEENAFVQNHLIGCRECTANLLEFAEFSADAEIAAPPARLDQEFLRLREKLPLAEAERETVANAKETAKTVVAAPKPLLNRIFRQLNFLPLAFAAVLLAGALAFVAVLLLRQQSPDSIARTAQPNHSQSSAVNNDSVPFQSLQNDNQNSIQNRNDDSNQNSSLNADSNSNQPLNPANNAPNSIAPPNRKSNRVKVPNRQKADSPPQKKTSRENAPAPSRLTINQREFVAQIFPDEDLRGTASDAQTIRVDQSAEQIVLRLLPTVRVEPGKSYQLQLSETNGARVLQRKNARPNRDGAFSLRIAAARLPAGNFAIRLFAGEAEKPLQEFVFAVEYR